MLALLDPTFMSDFLRMICSSSISLLTVVFMIPPATIFSLLLGFFVTAYDSTLLLIILPILRSKMAISSFLSYFLAVSIASSKSLFLVDELR